MDNPIKPDHDCASSSVRSIGKHNTNVFVLEGEQDVNLWDWTLMNAVKAEDDQNRLMFNAYNGKGTYKGSSEILRLASQKANSRCVALLQSSLSERGIHLIMDLQDVYTMRRRLIDVYTNLQRGEEDNPVLLLLQFRQGRRSLQEYVKEMNRRVEVCKMFHVHLSLREQIVALIEGLNCISTPSQKDDMISRLLKRTEQVPFKELEEEVEFILHSLKMEKEGDP